MQITVNQKPMHLQKEPIALHDKMLDCTLIDKNLEPISLYSLLTAPTLLLTIPSCDTEVCSIEMKTLSERLKNSKLDVISVSMDLPFAQQRWLQNSDCGHMRFFSDFRFKEVGHRLGLEIKELGLLARACFIIDVSKVVVYREIVEELTKEPNYEAIIEMANRL